MKITEKQAQDIVDSNEPGFEKVSDTPNGEFENASMGWTVVFKTGGKFFLFEAWELSTGGMDFGADEEGNIGCVEVEPYQVTETHFREVKAAIETVA